MISADPRYDLALRSGSLNVRRQQHTQRLHEIRAEAYAKQAFQAWATHINLFLSRENAE